MTETDNIKWLLTEEGNRIREIQVRGLKLGFVSTKDYRINAQHKIYK